MAHRKFIQFLTARKFKYLKIWRLLIFFRRENYPIGFKGKFWV